LVGAQRLQEQVVRALLLPLDINQPCLHGGVCLQGDGVWLPRTQFQGAAWVTSLHKELFAEYSGWSATFLEVAATAGAAKGFTEVIGFFHWKANNTGVHQQQQQQMSSPWAGYCVSVPNCCSTWLACTTVT
jgi:hypothetical protein